MRFLSLFFILVSFSSFAATEANCRLTDGIYKNSSSLLTNFRFGTIVDIFTLNNANTLLMIIEGEEIKLIRSDMKVDRHTKQTFMQKRNGKIIRVARVMIDRTPRQVSYDREFYGNIVITQQMIDGVSVSEVLKIKTLTYNFHCDF